MKISYHNRLRKIGISVFIAHTASLLIFFLPKKDLKSPKRIVVKEKIYPKAPLKTPVINKRVFAKSTPSKSKKSSSSPKRSFINELEKSLSVLTENEPMMKKEIAIPKKIQIKLDQKNPRNNLHVYESDLVELLQNALQFENYGDVKLKITIRANGKLVNFKTLASKNTQNEIYLKNRLPRLDFPCFNIYGISDDELTFVVKFCNNI